MLILGYQSVILWFVIFSLISYIFCNYLQLKTGLMRTIFIWTFMMVFVSIFEMLLFYYYNYLEKKGKKYYEEKKCYWLENNEFSDMFSYKMYMDLYADYSLADRRYCENINNNEGNRFVLLGEIIHGFFCIIMTSVILYYFFNFDELYIYIYAIIFSAIQFAMIIWYLATVFFEMKYIKNEGFWSLPLLWNVPWIIVPLYIMYYSIPKIVNMSK
jgi:hypothetical protein